LRDSTWVRTSSILSSSHRGDANRHGIAILLKSLLHLSYFPSGFSSWIHRIPVGTPQRVADGRHLDLRSGLRRQDGEQQQAGGLP